MKLIIDIPESVYEAYKAWHKNKVATIEQSLIANSKPYEERAQAEWIRLGSLGNGNASYECSNCYHNDEQAESVEVPYCWHCGAKMMKKEKNNEKT